MSKPHRHEGQTFSGGDNRFVPFHQYEELWRYAESLEPTTPPVEPSEVTIESGAAELCRMQNYATPWAELTESTRVQLRAEVRAVLRASGTHQAEALGMAREIEAGIEPLGATAGEQMAVLKKARALVKLLEAGSK